MAERASETGSESRLYDALDHFRCCKDNDIETFLRKNAFEFINRGWCSVYLIVDEAAFDAGEIKIDAYFTLSHKSLIPENVSKSKIKSASGDKDSKSLHFVLIGQLGKYVEKLPDGTELRAEIASGEILDYAFEVIRASNSLIPCRCALVECSEEPKVQKEYTDYEFKFFQYDRDGGHYQFYKRI